MRRRERRRHFWRDCTTWWEQLSGLGDETGGGKHEHAAQKCDRDNRHNERSSRAHRAAEYQCREIGKPGALLVSALSVGNSRQDDALIQVWRRIGRGQCRQQANDPGRSTELRGTCHARANVVGKSTAVHVIELTEQVGVNERARGVAIQGSTGDGSGHVLYMTSPSQKVAGRGLNVAVHALSAAANAWTRPPKPRRTRSRRRVRQRWMAGRSACASSSRDVWRGLRGAVAFRGGDGS